VLTLAFVPSDRTGGGGMLPTVIMLALFIGIFYFLLIRPQRQQQKQHEEMVKSLKRGDDVATIGGIVGRIIHIKDDRLTIKTGEDTRLIIERDKIARKLGVGAEEEES
jgi:preprotein translocase subunit YajC